MGVTQVLDDIAKDELHNVSGAYTSSRAMRTEQLRCHQDI